MPDSETSRSFPQPPRRYDGPHYDPALVEEDFEETAGIVRRFAMRNQDFTEERLIAHLAANGVVLYGTQEDWDYLFAEMREKIVTDAAERRRPSEITWVSQRLGEVATYTMVETVSPEVPVVALVADAPAEEIPVEREEVSALPEAVEVRQIAKPPSPFDDIHAILGSAPEGMMRRRELTAAVAKRLRISPTDARDLIDAAFFAEKLRKVATRGTTFIAVNNGEPRQKKSGPEPTPESAEPEERALTDEEILTLTAILDRLAEGHVTTGETIKNLERHLSTGFSRDHFRKLLRILEAQRFIRYDNTANYGKARKSPRVHFRGQDMKNRWQANRDGYINKLKKATIH